MAAGHGAGRRQPRAGRIATAERRICAGLWRAGVDGGPRGDWVERSRDAAFAQPRRRRRQRGLIVVAPGPVVLVVERLAALPPRLRGVGGGAQKAKLGRAGRGAEVMSRPGGAVGVRPLPRRIVGASQCEAHGAKEAGTHLPGGSGGKAGWAGEKSHAGEGNGLSRPGSSEARAGRGGMGQAVVACREQKPPGAAHGCLTCFSSGGTCLAMACRQTSIASDMGSSHNRATISEAWAPTAPPQAWHTRPMHQSAASCASSLATTSAVAVRLPAGETLRPRDRSARAPTPAPSVRRRPCSLPRAPPGPP
eukprot:scaffold25871_cov79-Isochrysis_galbana.AAC.2